VAKFSKVIDMLTAKVAYAAIWACFFLMVMTAVHVILRKFSTISIPGAMELTELSLVVIVFCAIGYLQSQNGHVRVDMFVNKFPVRARQFVSFVILLASAVTLYIMFYAGILQVQSQLSMMTKTTVLLIPIWPFVVIMTIGLIFYALSLTVHAFQSLVAGIKGYDAEAQESDGESETDKALAEAL
jgi:TRAP-type C4-dicarboxylate transport system permease small subunit